MNKAVQILSMFTSFTGYSDESHTSDLLRTESTNHHYPKSLSKMVAIERTFRAMSARLNRDFRVMEKFENT